MINEDSFDLDTEITNIGSALFYWMNTFSSISPPTHFKQKFIRAINITINSRPADCLVYVQSY